jgi:uncharacterized membrane protein
MKPLIVLLVVFLISTITIKLIRGQYDFALSGRIAMSVMLMFTAVAHFAFTKGMSIMIPEFIPARVGIVYATGVIEIAAAIALLVPGWKVPAAWFLILFFVLLLPANIYAAIKHVDYEKATFTGNGPAYLWFRVPLQILFIVWTYVSAAKF